MNNSQPRPKEYQIKTLIDFFNSRGLPLPDSHWNEKDITQRFVTLMEPYFIIQREVRGQYYRLGEREPVKLKRPRIDLVLTPKEDVHTTQLAGYRPTSFGVEIKDPKGIGYDSDRSLADAFKQTITYGSTSFNGYGFMPVFLFPFFDYMAHELLLNVVSKLNIGVISPYGNRSNSGCIFRMGTMPVWEPEVGFTRHGLNYNFRR